MRKITRDYPGKVLEKLYELKSESSDRLVISVFKGKYRVYKYVYSFSKELNKTKLYTFYIGRIDDDGIFHEAVHHRKSTKVGTLSEHISLLHLNFAVDKITEIETKMPLNIFNQ